MDIVNEVTAAFGELVNAGNMFLVKLVALLFLLEKFLSFITALTPWKWDDNIGVILANLVKRLVKK